MTGITGFKLVILSFNLKLGGLFRSSFCGGGGGGGRGEGGKIPLSKTREKCTRNY